MKLRIFILGTVSMLLLIAPQPAHVSMLRDARNMWKKKVIALIASPLMRAIKPPLKWKELSSEKKAEKLSKAKEKIGNTTERAIQVLQRFEKKPRFQHTATLIRLDLEDGMDRITYAKTPEEFEDAVEQLQESWNSGKEELRSEM